MISGSAWALRFPCSFAPPSCARSFVRPRPGTCVVRHRDAICDRVDAPLRPFLASPATAFETAGDGDQLVAGDENEPSRFEGMSAITATHDEGHLRFRRVWPQRSAPRRPPGVPKLPFEGLALHAE